MACHRAAIPHFDTFMQTRVQRATVPPRDSDPAGSLHKISVQQSDSKEA